MSQETVQNTVHQDHPHLHFHKDGVAHYEEKRFGEAAESFKQALLRNPDHQESHFMIGVCYMKLGFYERAIDHCQIAVALNPAHQDSWDCLARSRLLAGRLRESLTALRHIRRISDTPLSVLP